MSGRHTNAQLYCRTLVFPSGSNDQELLNVTVKIILVVHLFKPAYIQHDVIAINVGFFKYSYHFRKMRLVIKASKVCDNFSIGSHE